MRLKCVRSLFNCAQAKFIASKSMYRIHKHLRDFTFKLEVENGNDSVAIVL